MGKGSKSKTLVVLTMSLYLFSSVNAHNWLNSPSRSLIASTYKPCPIRSSEKPHVQIGPDQYYQVEWMQGHPDQPASYFALIKAEDEDKLKLHTTQLFEKYIADALAAGAVNTALTDTEQRLHWTSDTYTNPAGDYGSRVTGGNQMLDNPVQFTERANQREYLWTYKSEDLQQDVRIEYDHPEYTWIKQLHRFPHTFDEPGRYDTARFKIPGSEYGKYVLHWVWSGYYDCVDIDYIDQTVPENAKYGIDDPSIETTWTRIDHCYFPGIVLDGNYNPSGAYKRVLNNDPVQCLERCRVNGDQCEHVQVLPRHLPNTVKPEFSRMNGIYQTIMDREYNTTRVSWDPELYENTLELFDTLYPGQDELICYDLSPRPHTQTENIYILSDDPEDPVFYSTCYIMNDKRIFIGYEDVKPEPKKIEWRYGEYCIGCDDIQKIRSSDYLTPFWRLADKCVNCDRETVGGVKPAKRIRVDMVRNNSLCSTSVSWDNTTDDTNFRHHTCDTTPTKCSIRVTHLGNSYNILTLEQCAAIVHDADYCTNTFVFIPDNYYSPCWCHSSAPCCHECSSMSASWTQQYAIYEVSDEEPIPDPNCERGTLSLDGAACCSESCGYRLCNDNIGRREVYGHCAAPDTMRPCSEFPAPCTMGV